MPWARWPAMEHQPSIGPATMPASRVPLALAAMRPVVWPVARTRSWTWSAVLSRVMTSRSPGVTSTVSGTNRKPSTVMVALTVLPVGVTSWVVPP